MRQNKLWAALLCCALVLTACSGTEMEESGVESSSVPDVIDSAKPKLDPEPHSMQPQETVQPMREEYGRKLWGDFEERLGEQGVTVSGGDLEIRGDHSFSFTLLLESAGGESLALPVEGVYSEDQYDTDRFARVTWGGLSVLEDGMLALYNGDSIRFLSPDTLEEQRRIQLSGSREEWILGVCAAGNGFAVAVGGVDRSRLVFLDEAGQIARVLELDDPDCFRVTDPNYFTGEDRFAPGLAYNVYHGMEPVPVQGSARDLVLLEQRWHSSWMSEDGVGFLDSLLLADPETGAVIRASEDFYHLEGERRYTLLHYSSTDPDNSRGFMGMYYDGGKRGAAVAFPGPPSYPTMENDQARWTVSGDRVEVRNPSANLFVDMDFAAGTGSAEYRYSREDLEEDNILAQSPQGRYRLHGVNWSGAGDSYWGQLVMEDGSTGAIDYVCNLPVRYGGDKASINFADETCFTTSTGEALRIHTVDDPQSYQVVLLPKPDREGVLTCNAVYDIAGGRYLLCYLDGVGIDAGGWHDYESAVYHVAVFDESLTLVGDVAVPELEIAHALYAMPCPEMVWDGTGLLLGGVRVAL